MNVFENINRELLALRFNPKSRGFTYLREAIEYFIGGKIAMPVLKRDILPRLASKYGVSVQCVEKAMINSIDRAFLHADVGYLANVFGYTVSGDKGRPTVKEFIYRMTDKINLEIKHAGNKAENAENKAV